MVHYWKKRQLVHSILGGLSGVITFAATIIVLKWLDWAFYFDHWHNVAGILFMVLCQLLVLGGVFALTIKTYGGFDWKTRQLLSLTSIHKYFGYFMVFATQLTITTGILRRVSIGGDDQPKKVALAVLNVVLFFGAILIFEIRHQRILRELVPFKTSGQLLLNKMDRVLFDENLKLGVELVLLDDLVLNVKDFVSVHPGGKFAIRQNIGRDISKFFFGGYALDNNLNGVSKGHRHSNYARMIVNDLTIAIYDEEVPATTSIVKLIAQRTQPVNSSTSTFFL